jgi:hypothetical protein
MNRTEVSCFLPLTLAGAGIRISWSGCCHRPAGDENRGSLFRGIQAQFPTSNRIYVRIGYEPVFDSVRYLFGQERRDA